MHEKPGLGGVTVAGAGQRGSARRIRVVRDAFKVKLAGLVDDTAPPKETLKAYWDPLSWRPPGRELPVLVLDLGQRVRQPRRECQAPQGSMLRYRRA